jgi:hypothetical protein
VYREDNPLHRARLGRGIALSHIAARTLLSQRIVDLIDQGRFDELPGGVYARSYVRTFASAVGLDPESTVQALADRLPAAQDPFPALREIARSGDPLWLVQAEGLTRAGRQYVAAAMAAWQRSSRYARRAGAALLDAVVLLVLQGLLVQVTAWMCRVDPQELLAYGSGPIAVLWGFLVVLYFVILSGGGRAETPGARLADALAARAAASPMTLPAGVERALNG